MYESHRSWRWCPNVKTEIEIISPVLRCQSEEEIFFQRLSEVAGIHKVITGGTKIYLSVSSELEQEALKHVRAICDIWHTSYRIVSD
jgi:hypothetical protein